MLSGGGGVWGGRSYRCKILGEGYAQRIYSSNNEEGTVESEHHKSFSPSPGEKGLFLLYYFPYSFATCFRRKCFICALCAHGLVGYDFLASGHL